MATSRAALVLLFMLLIGLAAGGFWFLGGETQPQVDQGGGLALSRGPEESDGPSQDSSSELLQAGESAAETQEQRSTALGSAARQESFDLDEALWLQVHIALPAGAPADPELRVVMVAERASASDGSFEEISSKLAGAGGMLREFQDQNLPRALAWATRAPAADGSVRMPLPANSSRALLMVEGRYLYTADPHKVDLPPIADAVTLEPQLGAFVRVHCTLPPNAHERGVTAESFAGELTLYGWNDNRSDPDMGSRRTFDERGSLDFELRAVPVGPRYFLRVDPQKLVEATTMSLELQRGEETTVELAFELGAVLRGRVTDSDGSPLEGARVGNTARNARRRDPNAGTLTETDATGEFEVVGIAAGKVTLSAELENYLEGSLEEMEVSDGQELDNLIITLEEGATISGHVYWADGSGVAAARVQLRRERETGRGDFTWMSTEATATSDDTGAFYARGLQDGSFDVVATLEQEEPGAGDAEPTSKIWRGILEGVESGTTGLKITLEPTLNLVGTVAGPGGVAITEFRVSAYPAENRANSWAYQADRQREDFKSEDGAFSLPGLYPGTWQVKASAEGFLDMEQTLSISMPQEGEPLILTLLRSGSVMGTVLDPQGNPLAGAKVESGVDLGTGGGAPFGGAFGGSGSTASTQTDEAGHFTLKDLQPGALNLVASHADWADSNPLGVEIKGSEEMTEVVLEVRMGGVITGEVVDGNGEPKAGQRVVYGRSSMEAIAAGFGGSSKKVTNTDAGGSFRFEHVNPGEITVTATPDPEEMMKSFSTGGGQAATIGMLSKMISETVTVVDGEEVHVLLGAEPMRLVRLHGRVTLAGEPRPDLEIFVVSEGKSILEGMKMTRTDAEGAYEVTVDRPGAYVLGIQGRELQAATETIEFPVDVPDADELLFNMQIPLGRIGGIVVSPEGGPAKGVMVSILRDGKGMSLSRVAGRNGDRTDEQGAYEFRCLVPGVYTVRAGPSNSGFRTDSDPRVGMAVVGGLELSEGAAFDDVLIQLYAPGKVTGTVRDAAGVPVAGAAIFVRNLNGLLLAEMSPVRTNASGEFTYSGVAPGEVTVSAQSKMLCCSASAPVRVLEGEEAHVDLLLETGTTLLISLVDANGDTLRADLSVTDADENEVGAMMARSGFEAAFSTGIDSKLRRVGPLPPGKYRVRATSRDGRTSSKPVTLKGQPERKLKMKLRD